MGSLLQFVKKGNNAFISVHEFSKKLTDTLNIATAYFDSYKAHIPYSKDSVYYKLAANKLIERFGKSSYHTFFNKLDSSSVTILGYLKRRQLELPNFIRVKYGKGNFYLQLAPAVFSNYFMLKKRTYPFAYQSLHYLSGNKILWYDQLYKTARVSTPMRFILSQPALRYGWYLLLFTLVLFLIFKSKREQAAIPIIKPEENLSVAFAETIGSLYYENGHPGNMIQKKINYFYYFLKKEYRWEQIQPENQLFRQQAVQKFNLSVNDIDSFFDDLQQYQKLQTPTLTDLKNLQNLIEDFKQKIK